MSEFVNALSLDSSRRRTATRTDDARASSSLSSALSGWAACTGRSSVATRARPTASNSTASSKATGGQPEPQPTATPAPARPRRSPTTRPQPPAGTPPAQTTELATPCPDRPPATRGWPTPQTVHRQRPQRRAHRLRAPHQGEPTLMLIRGISSHHRDHESAPAPHPRMPPHGAPPRERCRIANPTRTGNTSSRGLPDVVDAVGISPWARTCETGGSSWRIHQSAPRPSVQAT